MAMLTEAVYFPTDALAPALITADDLFVLKSSARGAIIGNLRTAATSLRAGETINGHQGDAMT